VRPGVFLVHSVGPASLSVVLRPRGGDWLADDIGALKAAGLDLLVSMLTRDEEIELELLGEAERCNAVGISYVSVPIADLGVPVDSTWFEDAVATVIQELQRGRSVGVHCRQSIGRSGLFTCAVLVALGLPLEKAIATASDARGLAVPETLEQRKWLKANAEKIAARASARLHNGGPHANE
jgi:protein-tyrosine phosphatase